MGQKTVFMLSLLVSGCAGVNPGVPTGERRSPGAKPLPVQFSTYSSFVVENRFLILPVGLEPKALFDKSSSSNGGGDHLNLQVVDLQTGEHHRVFGKPVALTRWTMSFQGGEEARSWRMPLEAREEVSLRFPGILILEARTDDTNHDGMLTSEDLVQLYGYDLAKHELFSILPEKTTFLRSQPVGDRLVLILGAAGGVSIYTYTPSSRQGRFVIEGLLP